MTAIDQDLIAAARHAARQVMTEYANSLVTTPLSDAIADAVLAVAHAHHKQALHRQLNESNGRCRWCRAILNPQHWGVQHPQPHRMECRFYVGPLTHRWVMTKLNTSLGGVDHYCSCGSTARTHGDNPAVCPRAHETHRPMPSSEGQPA